MSLGTDDLMSWDADDYKTTMLPNERKFVERKEIKLKEVQCDKDHKTEKLKSSKVLFWALKSLNYAKGYQKCENSSLYKCFSF